jgi:hypothetical protein
VANTYRLRVVLRYIGRAILCGGFFASAPGDGVAEDVEERIRDLDLTPRMKVKLHIVSRTVADFYESRDVRIGDVKEAIALMGLDQNYFRLFTT